MITPYEIAIVLVIAIFGITKLIPFFCDDALSRLTEIEHYTDYIGVILNIGIVLFLYVVITIMSWLIGLCIIDILGFQPR